MQRENCSNSEAGNQEEDGEIEKIVCFLLFSLVFRSLGDQIYTIYPPIPAAVVSIRSAEANTWGLIGADATVLTDL